jgi:ABC-type microcin C transport system permease subunit YejE
MKIVVTIIVVLIGLVGGALILMYSGAYENMCQRVLDLLEREHV